MAGCALHSALVFMLMHFYACCTRNKASFSPCDLASRNPWVDWDQQFRDSNSPQYWGFVCLLQKRHSLSPNTPEGMVIYMCKWHVRDGTAQTELSYHPEDDVFKGRYESFMICRNQMKSCDVHACVNFHLICKVTLVPLFTNSALVYPSSTSWSHQRGGMEWDEIVNFKKSNFKTNILSLPI